MRTTALLLLLAAACSSAPSRPMTSGERMYRAKCTSCHKVYQPSDQSPRQWAATVDRMEAEKKVHLSPDERAEILGYLAGNPALR
jgi:cytochrome c2